MATKNGFLEAREHTVKDATEFFASKWLRPGMRVTSQDGLVWDVVERGAGDFDHGVSSVGVSVVPDSLNRLSAIAFGITPQGADNVTRFQSLVGSSISKNSIIHFPAGRYQIPIRGAFNINGSFRVTGDGPETTIIDGGGRSYAAIIRLQKSEEFVSIRGISFANFHRPLHAGGSNFAIHEVVLNDVSYRGCSTGATLGCLIGKADVSKYTADDIRPTIDFTISTYALQLGFSGGNLTPLGDYRISDVNISNVNGVGLPPEIGVNGMMIIGHRADISKVKIVNVRGETNSQNCEGFYGKLSSSSVSNVYLENAGQTEGCFVIKGYTNEVSGFPSERNTVRNIHVKCTDGLSKRGLYYATDSVQTYDCTVEGDIESAYTVYGQSSLQRFTFHGCGVARSTATAGWTLLSGQVSLADCHMLGSYTNATKNRPISFARVPEYAVGDVALSVSDCIFDVPTTYDGTGTTTVMWLRNPSNLKSSLSISRMTANDSHSGASSYRGIYIDGTGSVNYVNVKSLRLGGNITSPNAIRTATNTPINSMTISEWDDQSIANFTSSQTIYEGYLGKTLTNSGATVAITITLPKARIGSYIRFFVAAGGNNINISPMAGETPIVGSTSVTAGTSKVASCVTEGVWCIT